MSKFEQTEIMIQTMEEEAQLYQKSTYSILTLLCGSAAGSRLKLTAHLPAK